MVGTMLCSLCLLLLQSRWKPSGCWVNIWEHWWQKRQVGRFILVRKWSSLRCYKLGKQNSSSDYADTTHARSVRALCGWCIPANGNSELQFLLHSWALFERGSRYRGLDASELRRHHPDERDWNSTKLSNSNTETNHYLRYYTICSLSASSMVILIIEGSTHLKIFLFTTMSVELDLPDKEIKTIFGKSRGWRQQLLHCNAFIIWVLISQKSSLLV